MMRTRFLQAGLVSAAFAIGMCTAAPSHALTWTIFNDENDTPYNGLVRTFEAEGRIGDRSTSSGGPNEARLGALATTPSSQAQYVFNDAANVNFSLIYNRTTNLVTFDVNTGGSPSAITYTTMSQPTNELFVRLFAAQTNEVTYIGNLRLDGTLVGTGNFYAGQGSGNGQFLHVRLSGPEFNDGFTLTGQASFNYTGSFTPDDLSYRIIGVAPVPVPAAVWLFGSGLIGLAGVLRKKLGFA